VDSTLLIGTVKQKILEKRLFFAAQRLLC